MFAGEDSGLMHVIDISNPASPRTVTTHVFSKTGDGRPRDVAICNNEIAVAVTSPIKDVYEGHVYFFHTLQRGETQLKADGKLTGQCLKSTGIILKICGNVYGRSSAQIFCIPYG